VFFGGSDLGVWICGFVFYFGLRLEGYLVRGGTVTNMLQERLGNLILFAALSEGARESLSRYRGYAHG